MKPLLVIVSDVVEYVDGDGFESDFPLLCDLFAGTEAEARELYKDEPEVLDELDALLKRWPHRRPDELRIESVFSLGAMGRFAVALEAPRED